MDPIARISGSPFRLGTSETQKRPDSQFLETLKGFTRQVDKEIQEADLKAQEFAVGKKYDLHDIMVATEKADLSFRLLLQVRNKLLEAYQEIMRMQF